MFFFYKTTTKANGVIDGPKLQQRCIIGDKLYVYRYAIKDKIRSLKNYYKKSQV